MSEATLKTDIFNWLQSIVPALWVGEGDLRPANKTAFVWHMLDNSRPATPVLEGRLSTRNRIGRDSWEQNANGSQNYTGDREEMLYLHFFGNGAEDVLTSIQNAIEDTTMRPTYETNGFLIVENHPIIDAHQYLDSMPEDGATLDLRIRFIDTWSTAVAKPGIISTANITEKVN